MSEDKRVEPTSLLWYHPNTIIYSDKKNPKHCPFLALISLGHSNHSGPPGTYAMKALVHSKGACVLEALEALYLANYRKPFHHIMHLYSQSVLALFVKICLHSPLRHESKREEWGRAIDSAVRLLDLSLIYLATDNLSLGRSEKLNLCYNWKKESHPLHIPETVAKGCFVKNSVFLQKFRRIHRKTPVPASLF